VGDGCGGVVRGFGGAAGVGHGCEFRGKLAGAGRDSVDPLTPKGGRDERATETFGRIENTLYRRTAQKNYGWASCGFCSCR
jgi:hypothetical protein